MEELSPGILKQVVLCKYVCMHVCMYRVYALIWVSYEYLYKSMYVSCKYLLYVYKSQKIDFRLNIDYKFVCIGDVNFDLQGRSNYVSTLQFDETK